MSGLYTGLGGGGDGGIEFCWRDTLFILVAAMMLCLTLLLFLVNPPREEEQAVDEPPPGNVIVEVSWPHDRDCDVDLWVQAPGDRPVGYSNMSGEVMNLLRDDLGNYRDMSDVNLENAYSRGIPKGEYCVNLHYYRGDGQGEVTCKVSVRVKETGDQPAKQVVAREIVLKPVGKEETVFRFKLTEDGELVDGSVHHIFKPLRAGGGPSRRRE